MPEIRFISPEQLLQLYGYYQINISGGVEGEEEVINEDLKEGHR